jgi:hypothetical protein
MYNQKRGVIMAIKQHEPDLLKKAELRLRRLSQDRLAVANDFLAYLEEREENEATQELLEITGFLEAFHRSRQQAEKGETIPFSAIRRNV